MRTSLPLGALGALCALGVLSVSSSASAAPKYLRLSYTGDPATSMTVTWNTTVSASAEVKVGTSPGTYTQTVTGTTLQANAGLGWIQQVDLTGLSPDTTYYYVAGSASDGYSKEASFLTGPTGDPLCGQMRFAFLADNRPDPIFGGGDNWPQILAQAAAHKPDFTLNGGDMVIDGDKIDQWLAFLGWTEPVSKSIPLMPSMGNHDTGPGSGASANYNQIFALPSSTGTNGSNSEDYYYFTYGNAIFVSLSTDSFKGGATPFATQAAWLDEVLTKNPKKWKFVYYHKPSYTTEAVFSISHKSNEENQNASFISMIDKHHVDVVFTSHNHWYERFNPSNCSAQSKPGSGTPCDVGASNYSGGTVHIVSGGAGAFTIPAALCGNTAGRAKCSGDHHYVLVSILDNKLLLQTYGAAPQPNAIIDTITITKAPDTVCSAPADAGVGGGGGFAGGGGLDAGAGAASPGGSGGGAGFGGGAAGSSAGNAGFGANPATGGTSSGGTTGASGSSAGGSPASSSDDGGCSCAVVGDSGRGKSSGVWLLLGALALLRRRRVSQS
ncbi:MAG: metallophosphoesterase family protein [Polyangiaceae bacterium]